MEVQRYQSVDDFLAATKSFRGLDPVRNGLITSIATSVSIGARTYEGYFWWAALDNGEVQGIAIRTVPYGYVFSPMSPSAAEALYSYISLEDLGAKEFAGPKSVIDFIEKISDKTVAEEEAELIYENSRLVPAESKGSIRTAEESDFPLVFQWMTEFIEETGLRNFDLENIVRNALSAGRYSLLEIDGVPVTMGGNSDLQHFDGSSIGRVGPIYTPREFRKNGYASAITSAITEKLLQSGAIATLYTQAENPTSNKIYQEIGYTLVDHNRRIVLN